MGLPSIWSSVSESCSLRKGSLVRCSFSSISMRESRLSWGFSGPAGDDSSVGVPGLSQGSGLQPKVGLPPSSMLLVSGGGGPGGVPGFSLAGGSEGGRGGGTGALRNSPLSRAPKAAVAVGSSGGGGKGAVGVWYGEKADLNPGAEAAWAGGGVWANVAESCGWALKGGPLLPPLLPTVPNGRSEEARKEAVAPATAATAELWT